MNNTTPLEFCINNVNTDVSYITVIKGGEQVYTRLTPEQYALVEKRIRAIVNELMMAE